MSCKRSYTVDGIPGLDFHCRFEHHPDEESSSPRRLRDSLRATDRTRGATGLDASGVCPLPRRSTAPGLLPSDGVSPAHDSTFTFETERKGA